MRTTTIATLILVFLAPGFSSAQETVDGARWTTEVDLSGTFLGLVFRF